jgi:hypothetical protein
MNEAELKQAAIGVAGAALPGLIAWIESRLRGGSDAGSAQAELEILLSTTEQAVEEVERAAFPNASKQAP